MLPTCSSHLPHVGIDEGPSSGAGLPPLHVLWVCTPRGAVAGQPLELEDAGADLDAQELEEIPPHQLEDHPVRRLVGDASLALVPFAFGVHAPWGDATVRQPRRQLGGVI